MKEFEILFNEPIIINAENANEALITFAEMISGMCDLNDYFYATDESKTDREKKELAYFFLEEFVDELVEDYDNVTEEDKREIADNGVEYWYSGNVDGTQYDCLYLGFLDWKKTHNRY